MATRTSHSSPCFLRVADARAASSASKITSLSTPFSFETASTTMRISLFTSRTSYLADVELALGREPCLANLGERHRDLLPIDLERDARLVDGQQRAGVAAAPRTRLLQLHEHPRADEAPEMRLRPQHPVEARRGHLERIGARNRVLDVEDRRYLATHLRAVIERDALFPIDVQPQHRVRAPGAVLELDQLVPQ